MFDDLQRSQPEFVTEPNLTDCEGRATLELCTEDGWPDANVQVHWDASIHPTGAVDLLYSISLPLIGTDVPGCFVRFRSGSNGERTLAECVFPPWYQKLLPDKRTALARCDAATPCRDGYTCAQVPGAPSGNGGCAPPYFIPSLQLLGHVIP
jgi:hypothetical protein